MANKISHSGIIDSIEGDRVKVRIVQTAACAACKVASHCNAAESKVKIVEVFCCDTARYKMGQEVVVSTSKEVANKALILGFGLPFLLLVGMLIIVLRISGSEGMAALAALGSLVPYYMILWLLKEKIRQQVSFRIEE